MLLNSTSNGSHSRSKKQSKDSTGSNKKCIWLSKKVCKGQYLLLAMCIISISHLMFGIMYVSFTTISITTTSIPDDFDYYKYDYRYQFEDTDGDDALVVGGGKYAIFYHAYINPEIVNHSLAIVAEQMVQWQKSRYSNVTLYYTHLGDASKSFPCPKRGHCKQLSRFINGTETDTLAKIVDYCQDRPDHNVIYLHSKGSFHPKDENNDIRKVVTSSALSDQCHQGLNSTQCNICSARFSPLPHWHSPGNMWIAKCSYIEKLYPILDFEARVTEIMKNYTIDLTIKPASTVGTERYAAEHWVHTHPQVYPCDVYPDRQWIYGYISLDVNLPLELFDQAPRNFEIIKEKVIKHVNPEPGPQVLLSYRLYELQQLYNAVPANNSFAWTWYKEANLL